MASDSQSVLIVSNDVVGEQMAGPGIRYYHLAKVLAREFEVVLAVPGERSPESVQDFLVLPYRSAQDPALEEIIRGARVAVVPAVWLVALPSLWHSSVPLVIDGYDPFVAEMLFLDPNQVDHLQCVLAQAYLAGDFFICASERQRDWWLGLLESYGRINTYTYKDDTSMRRLIDVVPFGIPTERPRAHRQILRETRPGISFEDKVILWGGGLWPWLDPMTAVRAVALVWAQRQDVRLIFPGTRHPNPGMTGIPTWTSRARELAEELGLADQAIFFGDWVPYADWPGVLLESDVGLSLHCDTLETRLSFRTRILDYVWAGLPMVVTCGDEMSRLVEEHQLGVVVDYEDSEGVAEAILGLLEMPKRVFEERFERVRESLAWEKAAKPLIEFCRRPRLAPDKTARSARVGNAFYLSEIARLQQIVDGYEHGRFIRFTKWLHQIKRRMTGWHK